MRATAVSVAFFALSCGTPTASVAPTLQANAGVSLAASQVQWARQTPGLPILKATLWGDPERTPFGELVKLPAGFDSGLHAHSGDYRAVVVAGTLLHSDEQGVGATRELAPGSYVFQPGKQFHVDRCKAGADCILFLFQSEKPDILWPANKARTP